MPRFIRYADQGHVGQYIHLGGKIGVQVEFGGVTPAMKERDEFTTLVKEIAMQVAAASPAYVSRSVIPAASLEKEKSIYRAQMENSGKRQRDGQVVEASWKVLCPVVCCDQRSIPTR